MSLKPLKGYSGASYPRMRGRLLRDLFVAISIGGSTLGGCGAVVDSRAVDSAMESGSGDAAACDGDQPDCGRQEQ
jgi:hypothetical protein